MTEPYYKTHEPPHCPSCDCGMPRDDASAAFLLLSRMRFACGDNGKRMQDELEEYLRDLKRDAERYRWLRSIPNEVRADHDYNPGAGGWDAPIFWHGLSKPGDELQGPDLDAAIDAAMNGANA